MGIKRTDRIFFKGEEEMKKYSDKDLIRKKNMRFLLTLTSLFLIIIGTRAWDYHPSWESVLVISMGVLILVMVIFAYENLLEEKNVRNR